MTIQVDGKALDVSVPPGSTVRQALETAGIVVTELDKSTPTFSTGLSDGDDIIIVRVTEEYSVEEAVIPFETQMVRNESLPEGEQRLIQPGENGVREITTRVLYEDGKEVSRTVVKSINVTDPLPEVIMVGERSQFSALQIIGKIAYISSGNAWIIEENTNKRRPVVTTGDLDGRIFSLSPDGAYLLFSRSMEDSEDINSLWVVNITMDAPKLIPLGVSNVIWYADWVPGSPTGIVYSTVEVSETAPGWQANNDLQFIRFSEAGWASEPREAVAGGSGGVYGWWGTDFAWAPDGETLAYTRPDGIGLVDLETGVSIPLLEITPYQTGGDWAWSPGLSWSPDGTFLYTVNYQTNGSENSGVFDLEAVLVNSGLAIPMAAQSGMFSYPVPSPVNYEGNYFIGYLQALLPYESESSSYRLMIMDSDGSNSRAVFPPDGAPGVSPQEIDWSPIYDTGDFWVGIVYQGNLWLVNPFQNLSQQITGDGLVSTLDWR
ncbi:MAG: G5 domain-containing protein [Anaerolineales bacterium]|nr:G5 domain-containing protein [Anaerolineales bacterium]